MASPRKETRHLSVVPDPVVMPAAIVPRVTRSASTRMGILTFVAGRVITEPAMIFAAVNCGLPYDLPE